jgi:hypothetical protein
MAPKRQIQAIIGNAIGKIRTNITANFPYCRPPFCNAKTVDNNAPSTELVQEHFTREHWSFRVHKMQAFTAAANMRSPIKYGICLRVRIHLGYEPVPFTLAKVQTDDRTKALMNSCHPTDQVMSGKGRLMFHLSAQLRSSLEINDLHSDLILRNFCAAPESESKSHELFCVNVAVCL